MAAVGLSVWWSESSQIRLLERISQLGLNVQKDQQTEMPQILVAEAMHQSPLMLPAAPVLQAGLAMTRVVAQC